MNILIVSYGSIGKRHAENLRSMGHEVTLLRHENAFGNEEGFKEYYSYEALDKAQKPIHGAVICSPTARHYHDVSHLISNGVPVLIEKPPADTLYETLKIKKLIQKAKFGIYDIAYNFRYYPVLNFLKENLPRIGKVYATQIYAGYYLPYWRKNVDYRKTISAQKELGGGVHNELVHEIDYLIWLLGMPKSVFGYVNQISDLEISTADICSSILEFADGSVAELHLNYLSRDYMRGCRIIAEGGTLTWNFNDKKVAFFKKGGRGFETIYRLDAGYDFNDTYKDEVANFIGMINGEKQQRVSIDDAIQVAMVLDAIKLSHHQGRKISLKEIKSEQKGK